MNRIVAQRLAEIAQICRRYHVASLDLFGSGASDQFDEHTSDLDFFVEFQPDAERSFKLYLALVEELKDLLGREVDLIEPSGIHNPYFWKKARPQRVRVYAA